MVMSVRMAPPLPLILLLMIKALSFSVSFGVELCVGVCGASAALLIVMFICRRKSLRRKASEHKPENDDVSNDTYNALELKTRSSDLYDTLTPDRKMMQ
ncbi:putative B-cell receptor CD22-like [Triplophysa rosa]|uniref:B-cell receptor CD22-like n=1 Tax=Triplophysa rosa TaxID=992332 RepID=A0A9W7WZZ2_TRIRA|nr:putative B-cell receptor CD22-like [Triplophysa rosa]